MTALVAALEDQLGTHEAALRALQRYANGEHAACCSTHAIAECYSTLTALRVATRISPDEARGLIEDSVLGRLAVVPLAPTDYVVFHSARLHTWNRKGLPDRFER